MKRSIAWLLAQTGVPSGAAAITLAQHCLFNSSGWFVASDSPPHSPAAEMLKFAEWITFEALNTQDSPINAVYSQNLHSTT